MLEITLARLREFGVREVIINVHHFADKVSDYLQANHDFGMHVEISSEDVLLDTGGGLKKAAWFFLEDDGQRDEPFILHNVDVISTIDLERMRQALLKTSLLATLAVQARETSRYLLFDQDGQLCGRRKGRDQPPELVRPTQEMNAWAFSGIHVISPRIFSVMTEEGGFSIIDAYLRLAAAGEKIIAFRADQYYWRDLGRPESIAQASQDFKDKLSS